MALVKINNTYFVNTTNITHLRYGAQQANDVTHAVWVYSVGGGEPVYIPCKSELDMIRALNKLGAQAYEER